MGDSLSCLDNLFVLLNPRTRSLSLVTVMTRSDNTSVGREEVTPSISIPLGVLAI